MWVLELAAFVTAVVVFAAGYYTGWKVHKLVKETT